VLLAGKRTICYFHGLVQTTLICHCNTRVSLLLPFRPGCLSTGLIADTVTRYSCETNDVFLNIPCMLAYKLPAMPAGDFVGIVSHVSIDAPGDVKAYVRLGAYPDFSGSLTCTTTSSVACKVGITAAGDIFVIVRPTSLSLTLRLQCLGNLRPLDSKNLILLLILVQSLALQLGAPC